jgi:hypothetical protein
VSKKSRVVGTSNALALIANHERKQFSYGIPAALYCGDGSGWILGNPETIHNNVVGNSRLVVDGWVGNPEIVCDARKISNKRWASRKVQVDVEGEATPRS